MERFKWLAAIIAAHPDHKLVGRTRLQKTVKLLQRLGAPLDYSYMLHFYGPYSEDLQAEIGLIENLGLIKEEPHTNHDGVPYYILEATESAQRFANNPEMKPFLGPIEIMSQTELVVLELAATYDAFKELGADDNEAMMRLRRKKGEKCNEGRVEKALELLKAIGLN
jgi:uncharacterized protein